MTLETVFIEWQKSVTEGLKEYCSLIDSSSSFRAYRYYLTWFIEYHADDDFQIGTGPVQSPVHSLHRPHLTRSHICPDWKPRQA